MYEICKTLEHYAARLNSVLLLIVGALVIALGLFIFLGGLGLRKTLFLVTGAVCGAMTTALLPGANIILAGALAGAGAYLAVQFEEKFTAGLAALIMAGVGFTILIKPYITTQPDLYSDMRQYAVTVPWLNYFILVGLILVPIVVAVFYWRLAAAVSCSFVAAVLMFIGAALIYLRSGESPTNYAFNKNMTYLYILAAITGVGIVLQLLFFNTAKQAKVQKRRRWFGRKKKHDLDDEPASKLASWRTS